MKTKHLIIGGVVLAAGAGLVWYLETKNKPAAKAVGANTAPGNSGILGQIGTGLTDAQKAAQVAGTIIGDYKSATAGASDADDGS